LIKGENMINCSNCGKPTTPRTVQKGPRGPWTANECLNGCLNEKGYKLTTTAPKAPHSAPSSGGGEAVEILRQILGEVSSIRQMVNGKTTLKNDPLENEVQVDEGQPF